MADFPHAGTVSSGTLRSEDLIPAFSSVLFDLDREVGEYRDLLLRSDLALGIPEDERDPEMLGWIVDELMDALDDCAPEGYVFGAHPGDGADFGFWPGEPTDEGCLMFA